MIVPGGGQVKKHTGRNSPSCSASSSQRGQQSRARVAEPDTLEMGIARVRAEFGLCERLETSATLGGRLP